MNVMITQTTTIWSVTLQIIIIISTTEMIITMNPTPTTLRDITGVLMMISTVIPMNVTIML